MNMKSVYTCTPKELKKIEAGVVLADAAMIKLEATYSSEMAKLATARDRLIHSGGANNADAKVALAKAKEATDHVRGELLDARAAHRLVKRMLREVNLSL